MATKTARPKIEDTFDLVGFVMAYEDGELDEDAVIEGFQNLIDRDLPFNGGLQGCYGRMAAALIRAGRCVDTHHRLS